MVSGSSSMQWSFSNKVSAVPQLLSFKASQDERQRKITADPLVSSDIHRPYSSVIHLSLSIFDDALSFDVTIEQ